MQEVLICGAGPTGLLLAILLKRLGVKFRIIDENAEAVKESRALGIQARTLEIFHQLGLVEKFLERGMPARGAMMVFRGKDKLQINTEDMARADTLYTYIFLLPQSETENILLEELTRLGVEVERKTRLISFTDNKQHIDAYIQHDGSAEEYLSTHYLCGCDGSHSIVRKTLGQEFKGDSYPTEFVMADAKVEWNRPYDKVQVFIESGRIGIFFPLKGQELSRVLCMAQLKTSELPQTNETTAFKATLEEVETGLKLASHVDLRLSNPAWSTRYHVHHRSVDRMRVGNVFLLGDAAHIHSPVGAQGMNTGLQDANNLAWKISAALKNPGLRDSLLETYQLERLPVARKLLSFTDRIFSGVIVQNKIALTIRNLLLPVATKALMSFPQGKRMMFKFVSQLNIHYHPNFLMKNGGMRAPNGKINDTHSLHDLMKGYDFNLLAFKKNGFTKEEMDHILSQSIGRIHLFRLTDKNDGLSIKVTEQLFNHYKIKGEGMFLVRPDGHIAYCTESLASTIDYPLIKKAHGKWLNSSMNFPQKI